MALKISSKKPGTATVTKEIKDKGTVVSEDQEQEQVEGVTAATSIEPMCEVGMEMSYTHNLGNYQSARVQVSLKVPCAHAEIDEAYDYAKSWVEGKLNTLVDELQAE